MSCRCFIEDGLHMPNLKMPRRCLVRDVLKMVYNYLSTMFYIIFP